MTKSVESKSSKKPSKASVARDYMKKIGAFNKKPPENWASDVEKHLQEQGFSLPASSKVQIYSIRSKAMKNTSKVKAKSPKKANGVQKLSIEELSLAKKYATNNGGIEKCIEVFKALQRLS